MSHNQFIPLNRQFAPLAERIVAEATVIDNRILRIDHFLNHRIEPALMMAMGRELAARIAPFAPDLVLTAEASGIPPALAVAVALDRPLVYAKKYAPIVELPSLSRIVPSPTRGGDYRLAIAARFIPAGSRVALIDDFLANGGTARALAEMVDEAGAQLVVVGFVVEKLFQHGRSLLAALDVPIATLAQVERMEGGKVVLAQELP
ncbi:MAG TPA: xanthine phosphoribosyltransferase [Roseiflexaceae bacterium]|nr:xanthine phosphoribosyltransferase [Roseiflexaceae bacterium]